MALTKNLHLTLRHASIVAGIIISATLFAYFLGGFNSSRGIESALVAKEKILSDRRCEEEVDFTRSQVTSCDARFDLYKEMAAKHVHSLEAVNEILRRDNSRYYALLSSQRGENQKLKRENAKFVSISSYKDLYDLYHDSIEDLPEPKPTESKPPEPIPAELP